MAGLNYSGIPSVLREFPINLSYDNLGFSLNLRGIIPLVDTSPFQPPSLLSIKKDVKSVGTTDYARDTVRAKLKSLELQKVQLQNGQQLNGGSTVKQAAASGISALSSTLTNNLSNNIFGDDTELGRGMGTLFSLGVSSATDTLSTNLLKGTTLTEGLGQNVGESLAGAAVGIAGNLIGKGINSIGGDSMLSRGIGQGIATGIGTIGGQAVSNLIKGKDAFQGIKDSVGAIKAFKAAKAAGTATDTLRNASNLAKWNLAGIGGLIVGSGLQAAFGPSHEYGGRYGNITQGMDMAYDLILTGIGFVPGWGTIASGAMALNKGLSNIFGSTDGMTKQDAILGSAFMPAPVKWLNMWGSSKTGTFNNLSWLNTEKVNSFMGNAFGNLGERFDRAREEAGKVYGTFSQGAKRRALENIDFANNAWGKVLGMADLNEILKIRSQYMSSINNQRYAQEIGGVWQPLARGKYGMKILNNATNHNIGQRLLSGAALIDNKQMILSAQGGTKVTRPPRMRAHKKGDESRGLTPEEQEWWRLHEEEQKRLLEEETAKKIKEKEEAADKFNQQTNTVMRAMTLQANETPFTGLEYLQAAEDLRQEKVEKFNEAEKIAEAAMMADLAVSAAPLLLRGFRWVFNKAGLLVKVPVQKTVNAKKITLENAASITPEQWTAAQDAAIARGDMAEAQRLRDLHSIVAKQDNPVKGKVFAHSGYEDYNVFDKSKFGQTDEGYHGKGFYFANTRVPEDPSIYMNLRHGKMTFGPHGEIPTMNYGPRKKYFYLYGNRTVPGGNPETNFFGTNDIAIVSKRNFESGKPTEIIVGKPNHIKSADAVTYNNGVRIGLGDRDNLSILDTNYGWQGNRYVQDLTTLEGILNFIDNDIIPRMLAQGHNVSSYTPTFRQFSPKTDALDEAVNKANSGSGAWFTPASNDVTIRGPLEKLDFGLVIHEAGGHGLRYNMLLDYVPTKRKYLNEYVITRGKDMSDEAANALLKVHTGDQIYNTIEAQKLRESYPWIKTYFERNPVEKSGDVVLRESGSVNTQFRSHYSNNGRIVGKELNEAVDKASPGVVLRDLIEQPYTSSVVEDIAEITGKDPDALLFYGPEMLEELVNQYPKLLEIVFKVKDTMKTVGSYGVPITVGGSTAATLHNKSK